MLTIYATLIFGIRPRFGSNLSKICSFVEINRSNWTFAPIYRKSTILESKYFLAGIGLLSNVHHIREMDLGELTQI